MKNIIAGINNIDVISEIEIDEPLHTIQFSETSVHSCPYKEVFWKYAENLKGKCDFNKDAMQLYWNHTSVWLFSCKFGAFFRTPFPRNTTVGLLLSFAFKVIILPIVLKKLWKVLVFCFMLTTMHHPGF